jgi:hypothetical protein
MTTAMIAAVWLALTSVGPNAVAGDPCEQAWHPPTSGGQIGVSSTHLAALTVWNDDLIAGGRFAGAGGQTVNRIGRWGCGDEPCEPADLNGDCIVNVSDLLVLFDNWG